MSRSLLHGCWEPCRLIKLLPLLFPEVLLNPCPTAAIIPGFLGKQVNSTWLQPGAGSAHSAPTTPCGKRSCEIRKRKACQGAANEFDIICQLCFDAPMFPFLFCSVPVWTLPAVPHSSSVLLFTRAMHPTSWELYIRTFNKTEIPRTLRLRLTEFGPVKKTTAPKTFSIDSCCCKWSYMFVS